MESPEQHQPAALEQQVAARTRELAVLNTIAAVVSQSLDVQQMLEAALDEVRGLLRMEYGCIYTIEGDRLRLIAQRGMTRELIADRSSLPVEGSLTGTVARTGQVLAAEHAEHFQELSARAIELGVRSYVGVPLRSMRQVIGVLVLLSGEHIRASKRDLRLLEAIGDHIGVALANAQLFEAEQRRRRQAETLQEVATVVGSSLSLAEVLQRILEQLSRVVPYDSATVQLLRDNMTEIIAAHGFAEPDNVIGTRFALDQENHPYNTVIQSGRPLILDDEHHGNTPPYRFLASETRSWMGVPLTFQGRTIGMLTLNRYMRGGYQAEDAALAASFASQAALALERARLLDAERHRRQVAEALREGLMVLTAALDMTAVLEAIVSQACKLMGTTYCAIYELGDDGFLRAQAACGLPEDYVRSVQLPLGQPAVGLAVKERRVVALPDAPAIAARLDERYYDAETLHHIREVSTWLRSLLAAPIIAGNEIYGGIVVYYEEEGEFSSEEEAILTIFASQAALAIKNARLLERERLQQVQLQALNDRIAALSAVGRAAAASLEPRQTLPGLSAPVQRLLAHDRLILALLDDRGEQITLLAHPPIAGQPGRGSDFAQRAPALLPAWSPIRRALVEAAPVIVARLDQQDAASEPLLRGLGSLIAIPLVLHGRMVGVLCLGSEAAGVYHHDQAAIAGEIAEEIAAAIVNAQLYHRSRKLVLAEERNRLARELHDSVTQSLFSISLTAQTARIRLETRPDQQERVIAALATIQEQAQGALSEMRSLIYELRPAALEEEGLVAALQRHVAAFRNRAGQEISLTIDEALAYARLAAPIEEAIYRITQEALHNIYKHAAANHVRVTLSRDGGELLLEVEDDGRGFDPAAPVDGQHFGRSTMRERAEALGGTLTIVSAPGCGTLVRVRLPVARRGGVEAGAVEAIDSFD